MNPCANLYFLSSLACKLFECLDETTLETLGANLTTLGDMLLSTLAHKAACEIAKDNCKPDSI